MRRVRPSPGSPPLRELEPHRREYQAPDDEPRATLRHLETAEGRAPTSDGTSRTSPMTTRVRASHASRLVRQSDVSDARRFQTFRWTSRHRPSPRLARHTAARDARVSGRRALFWRAARPVRLGDARLRSRRRHLQGRREGASRRKTNRHPRRPRPRPRRAPRGRVRPGRGPQHGRATCGVRQDHRFRRARRRVGRPELVGSERARRHRRVREPHLTRPPIHREVRVSRAPRSVSQLFERPPRRGARGAPAARAGCLAQRPAHDAGRPARDPGDVEVRAQQEPVRVVRERRSLRAPRRDRNAAM